MNCKNTDTVSNPLKQVESPTQETLALKTFLSDSQKIFTETTQRVITSQEVIKGCIFQSKQHQNTWHYSSHGRF